MKQEFNNVENVAHTSKETGETIWTSRSTCVAIRYRVLITDDKSLFPKHLLLKRGLGVTDSGKLCFPCGYVDRNETIREAAVRELYEESGILINGDELKLYEIVDDPNKDGLENITFHYDVLIRMTESIFTQWSMDVVGRHIDTHIDEGEVTEFVFLDVDDLIKLKSIYSDIKAAIAFGHEKRIIGQLETAPNIYV